ncbi:HAMP domain-containing sensor histidine kinase [Pseudohongiella sp.]|uniref:histidine kinase n=1 Tax=marine sediment metagenome TaxID=412755 RepID=A0A0F9W6Y3_9ZZZZ|nr:ATP-binding protein [Pseudohongiella sp.]HDZ07777.1 HAMP domain-containing protein [Pseudohongiella sp.]HEA62906.1 HAMP domain-containing protein [Pseudohongiella sp.]
MLFRTRSILQLTILGFLLVAALLISALVISAQQLDTLTTSGQVTVNQSANAMRASRELIEHSGALERSARQFLILRDPALLEVYDDRREALHNTLRQLLALGNDTAIAGQAALLRDIEMQAYDELNAATSETGFEYPRLLETAYELTRLTSAWVDNRAAQLRDQTAASQRALNIRTLLLVCTALLLAVLFVALITRPLRQLDRAIKDLGSGSYERKIEIGGPSDLQLLGSRLDWLRDRLQQLEQQRSEFLRHVSHELKTPLAAMQESAALMSDGIAGPVNEEQKTLIAILSNNCQRLLGLIEGLLRHNADSFAIVDAPPEAIKLTDMVSDVVRAHQAPARTAGITLDTQLDKVALSGDRERIRVIVDNLLSNAIKFSPQGGTIRIALTRDGDYVHIDVEDEGPGVPDAELEQIFAPFFQGSAQPREHYHCTGLGLAIAREYAERSGGKLTVINNTTRHGACFRLSLPRRWQRNIQA